MTKVFPPDPRIGVISTYNRTTVISIITSFYQSLTQPPYLEPSDILYPPSKGWPNINQSTFAFLKKTGEVIELLKHLPYHKNPFSHSGGFAAAPDTFTIDYSGWTLESAADKQEVHLQLPHVDKEEDVPPWVAFFTCQRNNLEGISLMMDTSDGTVKEYGHKGFQYDELDYEPDDPRSWRDNCDQTMRLKDYLEVWKKKLFGLQMDSMLGSWNTEVWWHIDRWGDADDSEWDEAEEMEVIICAHGWPDSFDREGCRKALMAWEKGRKQ